MDKVRVEKIKALQERAICDLYQYAKMLKDECIIDVDPILNPAYVAGLELAIEDWERSKMLKKCKEDCDE